MGCCQGDNGRKVAYDQHHHDILLCIWQCGIRGSQKAQYRGKEHQKEQGIEQGRCHGKVEAGRGHLLGIVKVLGTGKAGNEAASSYAEQVGKGDIHHEQGKGDSYGCHHVGVSCPAYEECVHNAVYKVNQLAYNCRYSHCLDSLGYRHRFK